MLRFLLAARVPSVVRVTPSYRWAVRGYTSSPRKYTKDHEWIVIDDKGIGTMGISQYAAQALGDVVYVELPEVNKTVAIKDPIGAVESVKAASDIYAPVSGKVIQINSEVASDPRHINTDSFGNGWLCKIELSNPKELDSLLDEAAYGDLISH